MTTRFTDLFNRADDININDADWQNFHGGAFQIVSNTARPFSTGGDASHEVISVVLPPDHWAQVIFAATAANGVGTGCGVICRANQNVQTWMRLVGNASGYRLRRTVVGVSTTLDNAVGGITFAAGDTMRLEVRTVDTGCAWSLWKNEVQFDSGIDTSRITGRGAGLFYSSVDAGTWVDDFRMGDFIENVPGRRIYLMP